MDDTVGKIFNVVDKIKGVKALTTCKFWASYFGLCVVEISAALIMYMVYSTIASDKLIKVPDYLTITQFAIYACVVISAFGLIWACWSKRIYVRDPIWLSFLIVLSTGVLSYIIDINLFNIIFPYTKLPNEYYSAFCVVSFAIIEVLLLLMVFLIETKFFRKRKLLICVAINNIDYSSEKSVLESLKPAIDKISGRYEDVEFVALPFDLYKNIRWYECYIKRLWVQADALIYSQLINDGHGGYCFTGFSSRFNTRKTNPKEVDSTEVNSILGYYEKEKDWNKVNNEGQELTDRIKINKNLYELLLIYVSCILLIKENYGSATNVAREIHSIYTGQVGHTAELTAKLFSYALIQNAILAEKEHDYKLVKQRLDEYAQCFPAVIKTLAYWTFMARIYYNFGDIPKSKEYTKKLKNVDPWGYSLNMGFYAIVEGKVAEFVANYKRLLTRQDTALYRIKFAINFLEYEKSNAQDQKIEILLTYAIALLYLYIDMRKSKARVRSVSLNTLSDQERSTIEWATEFIQSRKKKIPTTRMLSSAQRKNNK